jgi:hypothetical protein
MNDRGRIGIQVASGLKIWDILNKTEMIKWEFLTNLEFTNPYECYRLQGIQHSKLCVYLSKDILLLP